MTSRLTRLSVSNFRSIRGTIDLDMDAPVVLIHGPNGSGKTSLLSAIEFGLTGRAEALIKSGVDDSTNLIHQGADEATIEISCRHEDVNPSSAKLKITGTEVTGIPLLDSQKSHFFSERCFLAQSALSRLLEIYEHKDTRNSDSPLTKFVQELLGLDTLDNLVEGLDHVRDLRLIKGQVSTVSEVDNERKALEKELRHIRGKLRAATEERESTEQKFLDLVAAVKIPNAQSIERAIAELEAINEKGDEGQEWAGLKREINSAASLFADVTASFSLGTLQKARAALTKAEADLQEWEDKRSEPLTSALYRVNALIKYLPSPDTTDIALAHDAALDAATKELDRERTILNADASNRLRIQQIGESLEKLYVRSRRLDERLSSLSENSSELAAALSQLAPLIESDICPVCDRDFGEASRIPLTAHLSKHIAQLSKTAGELQEVSRERQTVSRDIKSGEADKENLHSELLPSEHRMEKITRVANLEEIVEKLRSTHGDAQKESELRSLHKSAAASVSELNRDEKSLTGLRQSTIEFTNKLGLDPPSESESVADVLDRCSAGVRERLAKLDEQMSARRRALEVAYSVRAKKEAETRLSEQLKSYADRMSLIEACWSTFESARENARELSQKAVRTRTDIVRRVFNDSLNTIWKDLFIRLAPDEQFIPAFALPQNANGPVIARLETLYRGSKKSGNPRAMLSAGNLNTAALTLFLSLHLSAQPTLPWLVIDDPVQSMDEIHIAQFAALLRTLTRQKHARQIIIAVHEKSLFDYLALELSPAGESDRLVTIELSKSADKQTEREYQMKTWNSEDVFRIEATG